MVERSIPSHIYILVSIIILLKFAYTKLKFEYFFLFIANFTNYRRINKISNVVRRQVIEKKEILFFYHNTLSHRYIIYTFLNIKKIRI